MAKLLINDIDVADIGVRMGDGFLDSLCLPAGLKDHLTNDVRTEDGTQIVFNKAIKDRDLTLPFVVIGDSPEQLTMLINGFVNLLRQGEAVIQVPSEGIERYHLYYIGSTSYGRSLDRKIAKISVKFHEPNPANRR